MAIPQINEKYSANKTTRNTYGDFLTNLETHPGKRDLMRAVDDKAIKRSIINLLKTNYYERPFQPTLGANLNYLLFENATEDTLMLIRDQIKYCIEVFEPRVNIMSIKVAFTPDEHSVSVSMVVYIKNISSTTTIDFILNRVR